MIDQLTNSRLVNTFGKALEASAFRHKVISNNLANFNTPGFKKSVVAFEDLLAKELSPTTDKLKLMRTNERHLPVQPSDLSPQVKTISQTTLRTDGNNVDVDEEMAGLAKNTIYYNAVVRQLGGHFSGLKSVISGQK